MFHFGHSEAISATVRKIPSFFRDFYLFAELECCNLGNRWSQYRMDPYQVRLNTIFIVFHSLNNSAMFTTVEIQLDEPIFPSLATDGLELMMLLSHLELLLNPSRAVVCFQLLNLSSSTNVPLIGKCRGRRGSR